MRILASTNITCGLRPPQWRGLRRCCRHLLFAVAQARPIASANAHLVWFDCSYPSNPDVAPRWSGPSNLRRDSSVTAQAQPLGATEERCVAASANSVETDADVRVDRSPRGNPARVRLVPTRTSFGLSYLIVSGHQLNLIPPRPA